MKICVVTVTYGNRAKYVQQLVSASLAAGVEEVFIFDNASERKSAETLNELVGSTQEARLLRADHNYGSAGGFKRALEWAKTESDCDFLWVLDDDNIPEASALDALVSAYRCLGGNTQNVLVSYRVLQDSATNTITHKRDLLDSVSDGLVVGTSESLFVKIYRKIKRRFLRHSGEINYPIVRRARASWGGLFLNFGVLEKVGYPNEEFYLYGDDFEFSDRLTANGYKIFTIFSSKIVDVDCQLNSAGFFSKRQKDFKVFYSVRNHVYLDYKGDVLSCFFLAAGLISVGLLNVGVSSFSLKRSILILKAIKKGYSGQLGEMKFQEERHELL